MDIRPPSGDAWPVVGWLLALMLYATVLGECALRCLFGKNKLGEWPAFLRIFLASASGFSLLNTLLFSLAAIGTLNSRGIAVGMAILAIALLIPAMKMQAGTEQPCFRPNTSWSSLSLWPEYLTGSVLILAFVSFVWLSVRVPGHWDDTSYHLPMARHYLELATLDVNPWIRFPLFPQHVTLLFGLALNWGGEVHAQALANAIPIVMMMMGLIGLVQWRFKSLWLGWLAVLCCAQWPPWTETLGYAYVDNWLALYSWGACVASVGAFNVSGANVKESKWVLPWIALAGLLAGAAASTKLFGALIAALLGFHFVLQFGLISRPFLSFSFFISLFGLAWYLRSAFISGDPVHPIGGDIFGHYLWNADDLQNQRLEQSTHGASSNPLAIWAHLQKEGLSGLMLGFAVWVQPRVWNRAESRLAFILFIYLVLWQVFFPPTRYLLPILPLASYLIVSFFYFAGLGTTMVVAGRRPLLRFATEAGFCLVCIGLCISLAKEAHKVMRENLATWDRSLDRRSGYRVMQEANQLSTRFGNRLLHLGYENAVYFFDGVLIGDWFGPGRYSQWMVCQEKCKLVPATELLETMQRFGVNMAAINAARFAFDEQSYKDFFEVRRLGPTDFLLLKTIN